MFALLYSALKVIGQIPQGDSDKTISDFSEVSQIDDLVREPIAAFVLTGTISGNAGMLKPLSKTTRAEIAQVQYNLLAIRLFNVYKTEAASQKARSLSYIA